MRHLPIEPDTLLREIAAISSTWLRRAEEYTHANRSAGRAVSNVRLWSEIKPIFVTHQHRKCAYCERQLGSGGIEWDVEHFRPQKRVDVWRPSSGASIDTGHSDDRGYYLLAFEPRNYLACCKPCNSEHKRTRFPVAGERALRAEGLDDTRAEQALLVNPLDPAEAPPEGLIGFHAISPIALGSSRARRLRASATIEILGLARADLDLERAEKVSAVWFVLKSQDDPDREVRDFAAAVLASMQEPWSPMSSCVQSFVRFYERDRDAAREIAMLADRYVKSHSP